MVAQALDHPIPTPPDPFRMTTAWRRMFVAQFCSNRVRVSFQPIRWMPMSPEASTIGGDQSLEELRRELAEAREQQAATSEILRVISSSPMDAVLVFEEIAASAARLCEASDAAIHRVDGEVLRLVVSHGSIPKGDDTLPLTREVVTGRAVLDGRTIQVADVQAETGEYPVGSANARRLGHRTLLAIPLMRAGQAIGVIGIRRAEVRPFTDRQIDLLKTFADQAVIAIENTRLFEAEQTRTRELTERTQELTESLEYQTAISEVLAVISRSPSDLQPVLQAIVETAARLCHADKANIRRKEASSFRTVASVGLTQAQREFIEQTAIQLDRTTMGGRVALDHETVHIADVLEDRDLRMDIVSGINFRTGLGVPLLRKGELIGLLLLSRDKQQPFSRRQIALIETFAEQAVIAIENARLFEAEQASKRELEESLEYQTATSDVLGVIAASTTDIQPVLQTLVESACRLCAAYDGIILLREGDWLQVKAHYGPMPANVAKRKITRDWVNGRCVADGVQIHLQNLQAEVAEYPEGAALAQRLGARTILATPLMREGEAIGAIMIRRDEVRPFSDKQIALLKT